MTNESLKAREDGIYEDCETKEQMNLTALWTNGIILKEFLGEENADINIRTKQILR